MIRAGRGGRLRPARWAWLCLVGWGLLSSPAGAVQPDELLPDAKLESRARTISAEIRCLVCQNQSIDDSEAPLARDLRLLVRERLTTGDSDEAVRDFVVRRYGDFVLLRPPFGPRTLILWFGPVLIVGGAAAYLFLGRRRLAAASPVPLSAEEETRLRAVLELERG
ncbi:cytochrome c-type biogenesis protein [uncultured Enterovirga sp.]|uniref:cytochrome c-type biogenesis protein n=1 Tax=uncultured Enterovirga sp. TaxID=2026352 RepID=UPI0035C99E9E